MPDRPTRMGLLTSEFAAAVLMTALCCGRGPSIHASIDALALGRRYVCCCHGLIRMEEGDPWTNDPFRWWPDCRRDRRDRAWLGSESSTLPVAWSWDQRSSAQGRRGRTP